MSSPKSGTPGAASAPLDPLKAFKAVVATPGQLQNARPNGAVKQAVKLAPAKVAAKSSPVAQPPPPSKEDHAKKCSVISLTAKCEHAGRSAGGIPGHRLLQVVPKSIPVKRKLSLAVLKIGASDEGKHDTITVAATYAQSCGKEHPEICVSGGDARVYKSTTAKHLVQFHGHVPYWANKITPSVYNFSASGCQNGTDTVCVECFPSRKYSVEIDGTEWSHHFDNIRVAVWEIVNMLNGDDGAQFKYLEGTLSGEWGWEEYKDYRAFFAYDINLGFAPLFAASTPKLKISIANWLPQIIRDKAADLYCYLRGTGSVDVTGYWKKKAPSAIQCGGSLKSTFALTIGVELKAGNSKITQVILYGNITGALNATGALIIHDDEKGPGMKCTGTFEPIKGGLGFEVKGKGLLTCLKEGSVEVEFTKEKELWKDQEIWFLN